MICGKSLVDRQRGEDEEGKGGKRKGKVRYVDEGGEGSGGGGGEALERMLLAHFYLIGGGQGNSCRQVLDCFSIQ